MIQIELSKILSEFESDKITKDEAVLKIMRAYSPTGTLLSDKYCNCKKPWGIFRNNINCCTICDKPIKL